MTKIHSKPCPGKGPRFGLCPNLIKGKKVRLCPECLPYQKKEIRQYDRERGNSGERGYDAQWQKVRDIKAAKNPLCEECLKEGRPDTPLDVVHHIKSIESHPELRLVMDNLMSLCISCHDQIYHKGERWGR